MTITELVKTYDPQNQFDVLKNTYKQIEFAWENTIDLHSLNQKKFSNIIVTGLGGSAISGDLMQNFLRQEIKIPFIVNRNYFLPYFADVNTLLIVSSYSGNTEETISVMRAAIDKGCSVAVITTGGEIGEAVEHRNLPALILEKGYQPRYALGLGFFSLLKILQELNLISNQDNVVKDILKLWKETGEELSSEGNSAYSYAERLTGFVPVIYSAADVTSAVGYRFKCQINENSKLHAFHNVIPELNHNEIIGWESHTEKKFHTKIINILDEDYHPQIKKRFEITSQLASGSGVEVINLQSSQPEFKVRIMDLIYLTDWISYYLAVIRGFDPTEINNINILKEKLSK